MSGLIDWHSHHSPPELNGLIEQLGGRAGRPDPFDSPDFSQRVSELDAAGIDIQLISPSAGINPDRFTADQAIQVARASNNAISSRLSGCDDRFFGTIAISSQDIPGSVAEIGRMADLGFRAVFLYAQGRLMGRPEAEPLFEAINARQLPIFLHGGGGGAMSREGLDLLEDGGQGVAVSAHADAAVADCVVRMIAAGLFDRYPNLQIVIRSAGGGIPLLMSKLYWPHKTAEGGTRPYRDILREHFLVDCASANARTFQFLIDTMGEERVVFGSDYCGGLGPLERALPVIEEQADPGWVRTITEHNSRRLLHL